MVLVYPVAFWNPVNQGGGSNPDPHANNVVLFLKADQSSLVTNTTTTNSFTVPAGNLTVTVDVVSSGWAAANRAIRIGNGAGDYIITAVPNGTQITIRNCGGSDNAAPGSTIILGATIALSIIDSSPIPKVLNSFGNSQLSATQSKYNGSSLYFNNTDNIDPDILTSPSSTDFDFTSRIFTLETWVYIDNPSPPNVQGQRHCSLLNTYPNFGSINGWALYVVGNSTQTGTQIGLELNGSDYRGQTVNVPSQQQNHLGFCQNGDQGYSFLNGTVYPVNCLGFNPPVTTNPLKVGGMNFSGFEHLLNGYASHLRITKEVCRYTANFNPETDTYLN